VRNRKVRNRFGTVGVALAVAALPMLPALGGSTPGLVDGDSGFWRVGSDGFYYGNPGDEAMLGDWDCDGVDTPGVFRPSRGRVYLRNSAGAGPTDVEFGFGNPGDLPIAGDFDGDGCDTVSIYRPSQARFYILDALGPPGGSVGAADYWVDFGDPWEQPLAGDFDGDGFDEIAVWKRDTGRVAVTFDLPRNAAIATADAVIRVDGFADSVAVGDWDDDGIETFAVYRSGVLSMVEGDILQRGARGWAAVAGDVGAVGATSGSAPPPGDSAAEILATKPAFPMVRPVDEPVTSYFGWRKLGRSWRFHYGWDLPASCGTMVVSPAAGVVAESGWLNDRAGYGVRIDHGGGIRTNLVHFSTVLARVGDVVAAGEVVGTAGRTGNARGCHLHFAVSENGVFVNPKYSMCPAVGAPSAPWDKDGCPD
jgi:murein DD-endopeptidase MepM/ murein hydrolase activator NlpD